MIKRSLEHENFKIIAVENAEIGLQILKRIVVDMVISDNMMPGMTGLEFLKTVKQEHPMMLTVLQTGFADLSVAIQAINDAGVYMMIEKPWKPKEFTHMIKKALSSLDMVLRKEGMLLNRIKSYNLELREFDRV